jgi:hypothetical protein
MVNFRGSLSDFRSGHRRDNAIDWLDPKAGPPARGKKKKLAVPHGVLPQIGSTRGC